MDKRLMKLAGLLKEDFELPDQSPFEGANVFEKAAAEKMQEIMSSLPSTLDKIGGDRFNIYDCSASRGEQDGTVSEVQLTKEEVIAEIRQTIQDLLEQYKEDLADENEDNSEDAVEYSLQFISEPHINDYQLEGTSWIEIMIAEENFIAICNFNDADEVEDELGVYDPESFDRTSGFSPFD
jgi:hypothetical protein